MYYGNFGQTSSNPAAAALQQQIAAMQASLAQAQADPTNPTNAAAIPSLTAQLAPLVAQLQAMDPSVFTAATSSGGTLRRNIIRTV